MTTGSGCLARILGCGTVVSRPGLAVGMGRGRILCGCSFHTVRPHLARWPLPYQAENFCTSLVSKSATTAPTLPNSSAYHLPLLTLDGPDALPLQGHTVCRFSNSLSPDPFVSTPFRMCARPYRAGKFRGFSPNIFLVTFQTPKFLRKWERGKFWLFFPLDSKKIPWAGGGLWECTDVRPREQGPVPASWQRPGCAAGPSIIRRPWGQRGSVPCFLG